MLENQLFPFLGGYEFMGREITVNNNRFDYIVARRVITTDATGRPVTKTMYINQDYAKVLGVETQFNARLGDSFQTFLNGSYQQARGKSNSARESALQIAQTGEVPLSQEQFLAWDRPWKFNAGITYSNDSSRWRATLSARYSSGYRYTPQNLVGYNDLGRPQFEVDNTTLIPRPETELLIDIIKENKYNNMLDIGTGCGCIAITAILEKITKNVDGVDISNAALSIAKKNAEILNTKNAHFYKCNILEETPNRKYDVVISNPPYISKKEYVELNNEVKNFEPDIALTDFNNGMIFYKRYAEILNELLNDGGIAVFELSAFFSKSDFSKIFENFEEIEFFDDLNNDCRAVKITKK